MSAQPVDLSDLVIGESKYKYNYSGSRDCVELATAPTETTYIPGNPGAAWSAQEVSVTRLRILEMLRPELDTQKINFGEAD